MALLCHCDWQNELEKMKSVTNLADLAILYATDLALVLSVPPINRTDVWTQVCACSFTSMSAIIFLLFCDADDFQVGVLANFFVTEI